ncbi:hypothetical protein AB0O67_01110 [Streptomyces sp. NPDC086077]|uniref:MmyB family transcriptional regulator n=1 Tax=Streptomyces sp. NPDC086077 TaxID=3154862 RepID=UPI00342E9F0D
MHRRRRPDPGADCGARRAGPPGLSTPRERFRRLRGRHDVRPHRGRVGRLRHPQVGDLDLHSDKLSLDGDDALILVVFHAEPGSRSAELLDILGSLSAPHQDMPAHEPTKNSEGPRTSQVRGPSLHR